MLLIFNNLCVIDIKNSNSETVADNQFISEFTEDMKAGGKRKKIAICNTPARVLYLVLRSPAQEGHGSVRVGPEVGHKNH